MFRIEYRPFGSSAPWQDMGTTFADEEHAREAIAEYVSRGCDRDENLREYRMVPTTADTTADWRVWRKDSDRWVVSAFCRSGKQEAIDHAVMQNRAYNTDVFMAANWNPNDTTADVLPDHGSKGGEVSSPTTPEFISKEEATRLIGHAAFLPFWGYVDLPDGRRLFGAKMLGERWDFWLRGTVTSESGRKGGEVDPWEEIRNDPRFDIAPDREYLLELVRAEKRAAESVNRQFAEWSNAGTHSPTTRRSLTTCLIVGCHCEGRKEGEGTGLSAHRPIKLHEGGFLYYSATYGPRYGDPIGQYISLVPGLAEDAAHRAAQFEANDMPGYCNAGEDGAPCGDCCLCEPDLSVWGETTFSGREIGDVLTADELRSARRDLLAGKVVWLSR